MKRSDDFLKRRHKIIHRKWGDYSTSRLFLMWNYHMLQGVDYRWYEMKTKRDIWLNRKLPVKGI